VPDALVLGMIEERVAQPDASKGFILDGYPRNVAQAADLERVLERMHIGIDRAVLMNVNFDVLMKRLTGRRTCSLTGKLLNIYFSPQAELDACTSAGGTLVQRADDNEDTIRNRLEVYQAQTEPLIAYYRDRSLLRTVEAEGSMDGVYAALKAALSL